MKKVFKKIIIIISIFIFLSILSGVFSGDNDVKKIKFNEKNKIYIGNWSGSGIIFNVFENGYLDYQKNKGSFKTSVKGPITKIDNKNLIVTVLFKDVKFKIDKKPYKNGGNYEMVIDGNLLKKPNYDLTVPKLSELENLSLGTLNDFNTGIKNGSFDKFYENIATLWKKQTSVKKLNEIFKAVLEKKTDLTPLLKEKPIFNKKPFIDKNNILILNGYFVSDKGNINFKFKYIYEYPSWKVLGVNFY